MSLQEILRLFGTGILNRVGEIEAKPLTQQPGKDRIDTLPSTRPAQRPHLHRLRHDQRLPPNLASLVAYFLHWIYQCNSFYQ
jgi:hypothetical protein